MPKSLTQLARELLGITLERRSEDVVIPAMSDERKIRALFEALADSVDSLSDDEVLAECREDGHSPEDVARQTRAILQDAVKAFKQRAAREKHQKRTAKTDNY